jgi:hypothetical protein
MGAKRGRIPTARPGFSGDEQTLHAEIWPSMMRPKDDVGRVRFQSCVAVYLCWPKMQDGVAGQGTRSFRAKICRVQTAIWTAGSRTPLSDAIGGAQEKTRQAEQAEARHAKAHRDEEVIEVRSEPDRGSATDDRDRRADDSAGNRPSHATRRLPDAVERVADPEKSEERPNGPEVSRPDRQNCRIAAE